MGTFQSFRFRQISGLQMSGLSRVACISIEYIKIVLESNVVFICFIFDCGFGLKPTFFSVGAVKYPKSSYSLEKSADYQKQLQTDVSKIFEEEHLEKYGTPKYVHSISQETVHSGESALFSNKLLAPSRVSISLMLLALDGYGMANCIIVSLKK